MKKLSLFDRIMGRADIDRYDDEFGADEFYGDEETQSEAGGETTPATWDEREQELEAAADGELPIDMYNTPDAIVIRTLVAGVEPDQLDIAITRDMVTISGRREEVQECSGDDYFHRELFWGSFSRTVMLPDEVLIDEAEAREKHGYLEIILPKVDKDRSTRLNVKSGK